MKSYFIPLLLLFTLAFLVSCEHSGTDQFTDFAWPEIRQTAKPWTYWWWLGSAVDKDGLSRTLQTVHDAGMGGVHIIPIYGVNGNERNNIDYLTPEWMDMLAHTTREAKRLNMGVDMTTGTGWPFGGPQVSGEDAAKKVVLQKFSVVAGQRLRQRYHKNELQCLLARSDSGTLIDLTARIRDDGVLDWLAPAGKWRLYALSQIPTGQQVKRAAPGGEGNVLDPFSGVALSRYLKRFDEAFAGYGGEPIRAFYNDSYEIYGANWTDDFFDQFAQRRGYDLRRFIPALFGDASPDSVARIKCDYRQTIADLLKERYLTPWVQWGHKKGSLTRNQAHGSPGNLLDLYAAADIPETEIFGPSGFKIPGLRTDPDFPADQSKPDPLMLKFASSAAHVAGKNLIASESCTWLGEHFRVALSQVKPEIDQLFVSGVNHVFYHGMTYSPPDEPWPGRLFYASTNFGPSNSFWRDISALNRYVARCQSVLQSGQPANDILLYFPMYDWWNKAEGFLDRFDVHSIRKWLYGSGFHTAANYLWQNGFTFDYISDSLLQNVQFSGGRLQASHARYRVILLPSSRFIPLRTMKKLLELAESGAVILVHGKMPRDVPGFGNLQKRRTGLNKMLARLKWIPGENTGITQAKIGKGRFLLGEDAGELLNQAKIGHEDLAAHNIKFIRRTFPGGYQYFLTNLSDRDVAGYVRLAVPAKSVVLFDPLSSRRGLAEIRFTENGAAEIYLQMKSGESRILRVFTGKKITGAKWSYFQPAGSPVEIKGEWRLNFISGGPELPAKRTLSRLTSWTEGGDNAALSFAGTGRYTTDFQLPPLAADEWLLDLGSVCASARVRVNGKPAGILWSLPFRVPIGQFLRKGANRLEVEVTNLSANRIADLDRRGVPWKKFHDINFVNIKYQKFDASNWPPMESGLLGPVRLIPVKRKKIE